MEKRKYILRDEALSHPFANGKYDHKNADINYILGHESYEEWLETLPAFTEQDIVKPYLEKISAEVKALSPELTAYDVVDGNPVKDAIWEILANVLYIIDEYREENEKQ